MDAMTKAATRLTGAVPNPLRLLFGLKPCGATASWSADLSRASQ
jgi:hypothetical protein